MQGCCNPRNSKMNLIAYILKLLKVSFTNRNLRRIFWTHPDRDNLLGYARILSYYGIKIKAEIIENLESIDKQKLPYLSYLTDYKFVLIQKLTPSNVIIYDGSRKKKLSRAKFIHQWNRVVLQLEKTETAIEPFYKKNRKRVSEKVLLFFVFSVLTLIVIAVQHSVFSTKTLINIGVNVIAFYASTILFNKSFTPFERPDICSALNIFQCNLPKKNIFKIDLSVDMDKKNMPLLYNYSNFGLISCFLQFKFCLGRKRKNYRYYSDSSYFHVFIVSDRIIISTIL